MRGAIPVKKVLEGFRFALYMCISLRMLKNSEYSNM